LMLCAVGASAGIGLIRSTFHNPGGIRCPIMTVDLCK
jgi:hypothetical protein